MRDGVTPLRQQYLRIKQKYPQAIVFFRLGDFYETFDDDARVVARELEIVLTSREMGKGNRVPLAGIPHHALDNYLARLVNRGYKVAICEQMTQPGETRGLVEREVIRVVTPGTIIEPGLLESKANNYLVSLAIGDEATGIACVDITTSEFATTQLPTHRLTAELQRLRPSEIIASESADLSGCDLTVPVTRLDDLQLETEKARQTLQQHFGVTALDGYGCAQLPLAIKAAGAIIHYLQETQPTALSQLTRLTTYSTEAYMALDVETQNNLELFGGNSLISIIDRTRTSMGGRLLKRWLGQPLYDIPELAKRQDAIGWFVDNTLPRNQTAALLNKTADLERIINRVRGNTVTPREMVALQRSLETVPQLVEIIEGGSSNSPISWLKDELKPRQDVVELIAEAIVDEPSTTLGEGNVIRKGFSEELDSLQMASQNAKQYLANLERQEQEKTGIRSLKVGYNKVFGYYIEVSKSNLPQVPENYIRKQTLVGGERYFTPELKEYESLILNARDSLNELEIDIFHRVCRQVATAAERILALTGTLAHVDIFSSLAEVAVDYGYVRPELNNGSEISINQGRHPVVERSLPDNSFVANDTFLSNDSDQLIILTGPNMAGKSTYLKQVALIVLLAQTGSFVPARSASIGIVDRIFTRVGAREDLVSGQSTFMMEMIEAANILNNATPHSLIILDEIGRGTSTYDGLAIARSVAEYIHNHPALGAKTLFATHYHELVALADFLPRVRNYNVAVSEQDGKVVFLRRIVPGGVDRSYGIHVAQLAGLPRSVIGRAHEVLIELEEGSQKTGLTRKKRRPKQEPSQQLAFFNQPPPVLQELAQVDIDSLTPLQALTTLHELQKKAREG